MNELSVVKQTHLRWFIIGWTISNSMVCRLCREPNLKICSIFQSIEQFARMKTWNCAEHRVSVLYYKDLLKCRPGIWPDGCKGSVNAQNHVYHPKLFHSLNMFKTWDQSSPSICGRPLHCPVNMAPLFAFYDWQLSWDLIQTQWGNILKQYFTKKD